MAYPLALQAIQKNHVRQHTLNYILNYVEVCGGLNFLFSLINLTRIQIYHYQVFSLGLPAYDFYSIIAQCIQTIADSMIDIRNML